MGPEVATLRGRGLRRRLSAGEVPVGEVENWGAGERADPLGGGLGGGGDDEREVATRERRQRREGGGEEGEAATAKGRRR